MKKVGLLILMIILVHRGFGQDIKPEVSTPMFIRWSWSHNHVLSSPWNFPAQPGMGVNAALGLRINGLGVKWPLEAALEYSNFGFHNTAEPAQVFPEIQHHIDLLGLSLVAKPTIFSKGMGRMYGIVGFNPSVILGRELRVEGLENPYGSPKMVCPVRFGGGYEKDRWAVDLYYDVSDRRIGGIYYGALRVGFSLYF
ncbi:hypothetical protein [Persicobacter diffluens]|uniref:Outer membrane protein beta-barrel domain-containing protein n=1 Tax=Persicobacter diffluens TaxID=981 RepID=A0AAN4W313_9BACT|nr:hypothetical protein PEDI_38690 [Persicobacter diffluens]